MVIPRSSLIHIGEIVWSRREITLVNENERSLNVYGKFVHAHLEWMYGKFVSLSNKMLVLRACVRYRFYVSVAHARYATLTLCFSILFIFIDALSRVSRRFLFLILRRADILSVRHLLQMNVINKYLRLLNQI